jgi:oligopeptide transport system permease protein
MRSLILRRLLQLPLILAVIYTLTLTLAWAVPGNPLDNPDGPQPPPEAAAAMRAQYHLDHFWSFYFSYLDSACGVRYVRETLNGEAHAAASRAAAAGLRPPQRHVFDLGPSLRYRDQRVSDILAAALPVSVAVGATAILFGLAMGLAAGVVGSLRPGGVLDYATLILSLLGISVPAFVVGTLLLSLFALRIGWPPVGEWGRARDLFLPALTLSLPYAAYIARLTRLGMIEALRSDYVRTARAKGLPEHRVILVHALRNALLPVVSYLGPALAAAMTGSFVVEVIFTVPGLGQHFVAAVQNKDLFLIIGVVLTFSTMLVLLNLAVDVLYRWIDPRAAIA